MNIHFLDVGSKQYGDCILVVDDNVSVLIDGAHAGDISGSASFLSIPDQIKAILGTTGEPVPLSLLVVTHCHADHIGCLPEMVARGMIAPAVALVADENVGYGMALDDSPFDSLPRLEACLLMSLQEEPPLPNATDQEIQSFILDAADQRSRYVAMLQTLEERGTRVIRYQGRTPEVLALEAEFAPIGLSILGPTTEHLLLCAEALRTIGSDAIPAIASLLSGDGNLAAAYRTLTLGQPGRDSVLPDAVLDFLDAGSSGAAKNDQSIVLAVGKGSGKALLTGDMQFAKAEVAGLDDEMKQLLEAAVAAGPYAFVKLPHHASYNAFDERVLQAFSPTRHFAISTGIEGMHHPNPRVLRMLKNAQPRVSWARTDRNGHITVDITRGRVRLDVHHGNLDDPQPKARDDVAPASVAGPVAAPPANVLLAAPPPAAQGVPVTVHSDSFVEITARIPSNLPQVTIRVEIAQPAGGGAGPDPGPVQRVVPRADPVLANGRTLPRLLFVTDRDRLQQKIGATGYERCRSLLAAAGQPLLEIADRNAPFAQIRQAGGGAQGVVILGDYDVVPALIYDVLPPDMRRRVQARNDPDQFVVWSDQQYGDLDGDGLGDVPVSRVPDCTSAGFLFGCLTAADRRQQPAKFAVRNSRRPFADQIFRAIPGNGAMLVSGPESAASVAPTHFDASGLYFMLHGSDADATKYWGEDDSGSVEALTIDALAHAAGATVLTGCCWGALTVRQIASQATSHWNVTPRNPQSSLALRFLELGALAYIGCTGAHYSPLTDGLDFFGEPMHRAFWTSYANGVAPAKALFDAKQTYILAMPHGRQTVPEWAIEYKILRQFTCLGLGW